MPEVTLVDPGLISADDTLLLAEQANHCGSIHCTLDYIALTVTLVGVALNFFVSHLKLVTKNRGHKGISDNDVLLTVDSLSDLVGPPDMKSILLEPIYLLYHCLQLAFVSSLLDSRLIEAAGVSLVLLD